MSADDKNLGFSQSAWYNQIKQIPPPASIYYNTCSKTAPHQNLTFHKIIIKVSFTPLMEKW